MRNTFRLDLEFAFANVGFKPTHGCNLRLYILNPVVIKSIFKMVDGSSYRDSMIRRKYLSNQL